MQLSQTDKMNMVMKGLSPINPEHVELYYKNNGQVAKTLSESLIRTKVGEDVFDRNLGSGNEKEDYSSIPGYSEMFGGKTSNKNKSLKEQITDDMKDYSSTNNLSSSRLLDLEQKIRTPKATLPINSSITPKEAFKKGYQLTINYLNVFILNLRSPSAENRMFIYNSLKKVMITSNNLKSDKSLYAAFQKGANKAENELYSNLKK